MPPKTRAASVRDASRIRADEEEAQEAIRAKRLASMVAEKKVKASVKKTQESDRAAQEAADLVKQTLALSASDTAAIAPPTATVPSATGKTIFLFFFFVSTSFIIIFFYSFHFFLLTSSLLCSAPFQNSHLSYQPDEDGQERGN
jgi:multidrug efflux pump subunit AcrB